MIKDLKKTRPSIGPLALAGASTTNFSQDFSPSPPAVAPPASDTSLPDPALNHPPRDDQPLVDQAPDLDDPADSDAQSDPYAETLGRDFTSSIHKRLTPNRLREVNRAIVGRRFGGLRLVYRAFRLFDSGISFSSFYRYARRLRARVATMQAAELVLPPDTDIGSRLPQLIAQQMMENLTLDDIEPHQLHRLAQAYRSAAQTHVFIRANNRMFNANTPDPQTEKLRKELIARIKSLQELEAEKQDMFRQWKEMKESDERDAAADKANSGLVTPTS